MPIPRDGDIDYSKYTPRELEEALEGINSIAYPKNYENLCSAYERLISTLPPVSDAEKISDSADPFEIDEPKPRYDENGRYLPNQIPFPDRASNVLYSLVLLAYGSYGLWVNDLYIPAKGGAPGIHLHGVPAWIMFGAILCLCMVMLSVVVDHYDHRDNERSYRTFAQMVGIFGAALAFTSILWRAFS